MFYGISQVQKLRLMFERKQRKKYDVIFRCRYDIHFFDDLSMILWNMSKKLDANNIICPWERHHIGICDQLWFGKSDVMNNFTDLFDWIRDNINTLFFVNESVFYKFIKSKNIQIKCADISYVLVRENMIGMPQYELLNEYIKDMRLPWVEKCPERNDGDYQIYIDTKNDSANNIYFLTKQNYNDVPCKLLNVSQCRYLNISDRNRDVVGSNIPTHFILRPCCSYLVNIVINNPLIKETNNYLTGVDNRFSYSDKFDNPNAQFFVVKKGKSYIFMSNKLSKNS